jgi:hypothetical protein
MTHDRHVFSGSGVSIGRASGYSLAPSIVVASVFF